MNEVSVLLCTMDLCTGCSACLAACRLGAIDMYFNEEGFLEPRLNDNCVNCGQCASVCQIINPPQLKRNPEVYAAINKDMDVLERSSSGGVFYALAKSVIAAGGVVFGAKYDEELRVKHAAACTMDEVMEFQKSKYAQSDMRGVLGSVKFFLSEGREVMFTGTPCQVAAVKNYLNDFGRGNLVCVDLLCHGVGSPKIFEDHIHYLCRKYKSKVTAFCFRYKSRDHTGVKRKQRPLVSFTLENGKKIIKDFNLDRYANGFNRCILLRKSCTKCYFANTNRPGDLTIGDFWRLGEDIPYHRLTQDGVSVVLVNSDIGHRLLRRCSDSLFLDERPLAEAIKGNPTLSRPSKANKRREVFFKAYRRFGYKVSTSLFTSSVFYRIKFHVSNLRKR